MYNCRQLVLYHVNTTAYKYYFNDTTMMDYYCLLLKKNSQYINTIMPIMAQL